MKVTSYCTDKYRSQSYELTSENTTHHHYPKFPVFLGPEFETVVTSNDVTVSHRRISCTRFLCGCVGRCHRRRIVYTRFLRGCPDRCSHRRVSCTGIFFGCAHRCGGKCLHRHTSRTRIFGDCVGTIDKYPSGR